MKLGKHADTYGIFDVICKKTFQIKYRSPSFVEGKKYSAILIEREFTLVEIMAEDDYAIRFTIQEFKRYFMEHTTCPKEKRLLGYTT